MAKYLYDVDDECFKRETGVGMHLKLNITEAKMVENYLNLGYNIPKIYAKIDFVNDISESQLRSFIKNLKDGNINLEGDYPAPIHIVDSITDSDRISQLESRVSKLESMLEQPTTTESVSLVNRLKGYWSIGTNE